MKVIFEMPQGYISAIEDIESKCEGLYIAENKRNLSGDQIIAIIAIVAPIVWTLVEKYLPDPKVTIEFQLDEETTITISDRSVKRAMQKYKHYKAEYEQGLN